MHIFQFAPKDLRLFRSPMYIYTPIISQLQRESPLRRDSLSLFLCSANAARWIDSLRKRRRCAGGGGGARHHYLSLSLSFFFCVYNELGLRAVQKEEQYARTPLASELVTHFFSRSYIYILRCRARVCAQLIIIIKIFFFSSRLAFFAAPVRAHGKLSITRRSLKWKAFALFSVCVFLQTRFFFELIGETAAAVAAELYCHFRPERTFCYIR